MDAGAFFYSFAEGAAIVALLGIAFALLVGGGILWSMDLALATGLSFLIQALALPLSFLAFLSGLALGLVGAYSRAVTEWSQDVPWIVQAVFVTSGLVATIWAYRRGRRIEHAGGTRLRGVAVTSLTVTLYFTIGMEALALAFYVFD